MKKLVSILGVILLGATLNLYAQQSINSAGGESTGVGHASYSVGQITYTALESTINEANLIQGVQIPFEFFGESCATDFTGDGVTDGDDFIIFLGNFGIPCSGCPTDLNFDGITNGGDFVIFLGNFGVICN